VPSIKSECLERIVPLDGNEHDLAVVGRVVRRERLGAVPAAPVRIE
jgi:hypothetical protein